jgi:hypothetical protein
MSLHHKEMPVSNPWKTRLPVVLAAVLAAVAVIALVRSQPVRAEHDDEAVSPGRYTVVETEAHNLIVTDTKTNILYFYTIDKDKEVGSDLKLRGSINLNQVGKPVIKPTKAE